MKLLLTSSGITNESLNNALVDLLGKPISESKALFVLAGMYPFKGGPYFAMNAIIGKRKGSVCDLGWKSLGLLELTSLPSIDKEVWLSTVEETDALLVWGGDILYLSYWMGQSGLAELLPLLLKKMVYVGTSAGAMTATTTIGETYDNAPGGVGNVVSTKDIEFDTPQGKIQRVFVTANGLGLVDFSIIPHLNNANHADASMPNAEKWASMIPAPTYAIDDQTGIKIIDGNVEVVSEGEWKLFKP